MSAAPARARAPREGVRIRVSRATLDRLGLPSAGGRAWRVRDVSSPYPTPIPCRFCGHHDVVTYHFMLDDQGSTVVSASVWEALQATIDSGGFELANTVRDSPPARLTIVPAGWTP